MYVNLARTGYMRNTQYRWSHMINNVASSIFGFIYISLWAAVAPESSAVTPYTRATMTAFVVLAQVFAHMSAFLPAGLGIQAVIRNGDIALQMSKPVPFFALVLARETGNVAYQVLFRSVPIGVVLGLTFGFPPPASILHLVLTIPSLILGTYVGLTIVYTVGISSLWTLEIRWAHWLYWSVITLFSGGWIPSDLLPGTLGEIAPYLPFASQLFYPIRIYLGLSGAEALLVPLVWVGVMTIWCQWLTRLALQRVVVQGG